MANIHRLYKLTAFCLVMLGPVLYFYTPQSSSLIQIHQAERKHFNVFITHAVDSYAGMNPILRQALLRGE